MKLFNLFLILVLVTSCSSNESDEEILIEANSEILTDYKRVQIIIDENIYEYYSLKEGKSDLAEYLEYELDFQFINDFFTNNNEVAAYIDDLGGVRYYSSYEKMESYNQIVPASQSDMSKSNLSTKATSDLGYIKLYEHKDYGGEMLEFNFNFSELAISNLNDYGFGDFITSFKIKAYYFNNYYNTQLTFWDDKDYKERSVTFNTHNAFPIGFDEHRNLTDVQWGWPFTRNWNDRATSLKVTSSY